MTTPKAPAMHVWMLNERHSIATWIDKSSMVPCVAECKCGWTAASTSAALRNWNVEGHASDVFQADLCRHCRVARATWCEALCADCASLTDEEIQEFERTGIHPRMPQ